MRLDKPEKCIKDLQERAIYWREILVYVVENM